MRMGHACKSTAARHEELQELPRPGACFTAAVERRTRLLAAVAEGVHFMEGGLDLAQQCGRELAAPQSHQVQAVNGIAFSGEAEGRDFAGDAAAAGDHRALADPDELMYHGR